ncbi:1389_t:CDS:1, partial [Rhizophagus irregularis]
AKIVLESNDIFEWDVIIEKVSGCAWVGVCASENLNYETFAGIQPTGWVLGSNGYCNNFSKAVKYCLPFGDGTIITVHLDMNKRTCTFTINGTKYPEVSAWNNLPSKLYPVVSLNYPGRFRIQPHQKN